MTPKNMPETTVQLPLHRVARRWLRAAGAALAAFLLVTCSSDSPVGPGRRGIGSVRVAPSFDAFARVAPLTLDGVRVIVVRPPAETLAVVPKPFNPASTQLQLNIPVFLQSVSEDLLVTLELYSGQTLLFSGTRTLRVTQGAATPPDSIPVAYQGPGSQVAALVITPRDTTVSFGAVLPYVVSATDAQAAPVAQYYVSWSTPGAPTGTTIDASGRLTAPSVRDTFYVKAVTPNGVIDSTSVIIAASPSTLVKASGDGQTAQIGTRLAQPLAAQVNGTDGLPIAGVAVAFAVTTGGGSVDSATATTDAQGVARTGVVLGNTVGAQTFTASATGLTPVVFTATATGSAGVVTWTGATSTAWTTASNWSPAVVPGAADSVVIPVFQPNAPALSGNATIAALAFKNANTFLTLAGNLTVARGISLPDTNSNIQVTSGQITAGVVNLGGFQAFIDATAGGISVSGATTISGDRAFIDGDGPGSNSFGPVTLSGSQAFLTQRGGSAGAISISGPSAFWQAEGTITVAGVPALQLTGNTSFVTTSMTVPSNITFNGDVLIGGTLSFFSQGNGGSRVTINGNLATSGSGTLQQTFVGDTMLVNGNATFGGGDESASLTTGALFVSGNFSQTGPGTSFIGTGTHAVFLNGNGAQTINFAAPGFGAGRFQNVVIANSAGGVTATSDLYATGTAGVTPTAVRTLSGNGSTLFTTILNVSNFTFNNLLLNFAGSTVVTFDTVTFQGYAPTATPLTITHPGAAAALPFQDITFAVTPTTGFYIDATDSNPGDGVPLVIDMLNPTPATDGGFVQLAGGATINWPPAPPVKTWTGTVSPDWSVAGNWSPAGVPGALDDVTIAPATNQPLLTANSVAHNLTIAGAGARVSVGGHSLTVGGNLVVHTDGLLAMTNPADLVVVLGNAAFQGGDQTGFLSAGELRVAGDFNQQQQTSTHSFFATGTHRTVMTGAALQQVTFCCTAGASGFQELDLSNSVGINIQFSGNGVFVFDTLISQVGTGTAPWLYMLGSPLRAARLRVDKLLVDRGTLTLNEGGVAANQQFDNVTFQNYLTSQTQFAIVAPGGASVPRTLTFNNLTFQPLNTGDTGRYLNVTAPSGTLIVDLPGATPSGGNGPAFTTTSGAVTVNWPTAPTPGVWTGVVDTSWNTAGNWSDGNVPTIATDVTIPSGTPFSPATSGAVRQVHNLTVLAGATLAMGGGGLSVNGSLDAAGTITGNVSSFVLAGTGTARGNVTGTFFSTTVNGSYSLNGRLVTPGLTINGTLTLAGNTAVVGSTAGDDFQTVNNGSLVMTNPLDSLLVGGTGPSVTFTGGSEVGRLTAGVILVTSTGVASFTQNNIFNDSSYAPSGTHKVVTAATGVMLFSMDSPGSGSHFNILDISAQQGGVTLSTPIRVNGLFISTPASTPPAINGGNRLLTAAGGTQVTGLTLTNAPFAITGDSPVTFDNVTLQGFISTATQLAVSGTGATARVFNNLTFTTTPTASGFYLVATDTDGAGSNGALTVNLLNPAPATPGAFTQAVNGAVIGWPPVIPVRTWTGAQNSDWQTTTNWSPAGLPTASDSVDIPAVATQPVLSAPVAIRALTVQPGAIVNMNSFALDVAGALGAPNATSFIGGGGTLTLSGTATTLAGTIGVAVPVSVSGSYALTGRTVLGNLTIAGSGSVTANGQTLVVSAALSTTGSGTLTMTNALDSVLVTGAGTFGGGDESGILTAGYLKIGGSFGQTSATSGASFAASGTHRTEIGAGGVRIINFASPGAGAGTSHFNDLIVSGATGGINLAANTFVNGQLISHPAGATPVIGIVAAVKVLTVGGVDVSRLGIDQNVMTIGAGAITQFDTVSFTGQANAVTQLTINNAGTAAPLTFNALSFGVAPTSGLYIAANDLDGASPNALTINVVGASPAAPSPSLFSGTNGAVITWPFNSALHTWTGAADNSWENPLNWTGGGGPGITGDAVIPSGTPNSPVVGSNHQINSLTVLNGATLDLNGHSLTMNNGVDVSGLATSGVAGGFVSTSFGPARGTFQNLSVELGLGGNPVTLNGLVSVIGSGNTVFISGDVTLAGNTIGNVQGTVKTFNGVGRLIMSAPTDLVVADSVAFSGGDETGQLTAGVIQTRSISAASPNAFIASGSHKVVLGGPTPSTLFFANPANNHFQELDVTSVTATLTLGSNVTVAGQLLSNPGGVPGPTVTGSGFTLTAGGAAISAAPGITSLTMNGVPLVLSGGTISALGNITFSNQNSSGIALTVNNVGTAAPFTFAELNFPYATTAGGFYIQANDLDGASPNALTIDVVGANPATPGGGAQANNGAIINWPPAGPVTTWTGAVSSDWSVPGNWSTGVVPTAADDVVIPVATPTVTVTGACTAKSLLMNGTMDLGTNNCQVQGDVTANGFINSTGGVIQMQAVGQVRGNLPGLEVSAPVTLVGNTGLGSGPGNLVVTGAGTTLTLNGNTMASPGSLTVQNGAVVVMTNPADVLSFTGTVIFDGGDETGLLTAGQLTFAGNFSQGASSSPASFFASGNHLTRIGGLGNVGVSFATPGSSRFQELDLSPMGSNAFTIGTDVTVAGQLTVVPTGTGPTINDLGSSTFTAGGAQIGTLSLATALTMDGVPLVLSGGAISAFDHITFTNQSPVGTALTVNNVGQAAPYTFTNLTFTTFLTAGGFHIQANDLDGASPNALTIDVINSNPATGGGAFQANNGAVINWPPSGGTITWTGGAGSDWSNASNWSGGVVPGVADNVVIAFVTTSPVLTANVSVNNLTVVPSATIDLGGFALGVNGTLDNGGSIFTAGSGILVLAGTSGQLLRGSVNADVSVASGASYLLNGRLTIAAPHVLALAGILDLGGNTAETGNLAVTTNTGQLRMLSPSDSMIVGDVASFGGASTAGLLNAGVLTIGGDLVQLNTISDESFQASGSHKTVFNGATGPQSILFLSPGTGSQSRFQALEVATGGGNATALSGNANAVDVTVTSGGGLTLGGNILTVSGNFTTSGAGTVTMTNSADFLAVGGNANFAGGDATGRITAGVIQVGGNFTQGGTPAAPAFIGGGTNLVRLVGGTTALSAVGSNATTVFNSLDIATTGPVTLTNVSTLNLDGTGTLQILTPVSVTFVGGTNALAFDGPTTTVSGSTLAGSTIWLAAGSSILGSWNVVTTGWRQVTAPQLQVPFNLPYQNLEIFGTNVFLDPGAQSIPGNFTTKLLNAGFLRLRDTLGVRTLLTVAGTTQVFGTLRLDGGKLTTGTLDVATLSGSRGFLSMLLPADSVIVLGDALFNGGSTNGTLTAGVLQIGGNFSQTTGSSVLAFAPSGTHLTKLGAGGARTVSFANPGGGATGSHFKNLDITAASGGLTLNSAAIVDSAFIVGVGAGAPKLIGGGNSLTSRQWQVLGMVVDNTPMVLNEQGTGLAQTFNSVTFQGFPTTATTVSLMDVTAAGSALANRPITFNGLTVQTSLGSGGLYAKLVSSNGLGVTLTINGSNDPTGGPSRSNPPFGQTLNGARILWQ